jgi:hypothetical protein
MVIQCSEKQGAPSSLTQRNLFGDHLNSAYSSSSFAINQAQCLAPLCKMQAGVNASAMRDDQRAIYFTHSYSNSQPLFLLVLKPQQRTNTSFATNKKCLLGNKEQLMR